MKKYLSFVLMAVATAGVLFSTSCRRAPDSADAGKTVIMCDESVKNIIRQEIQAFELKHPAAMISAVYTNERAAIDSLLNLKVGMIVVPSPLTPEQSKYLKTQRRNAFCRPIAVDAIAIIANKENPVQMLSVGQLADILTGKTTDWNEISPNKMGKIAVTFDHQGSSTVEYMKKNVTGGKPFANNVYAQKTNGEVFKAVTANKGAIGIIGVSWLSRDLTDLAKTNNYSNEELQKFAELSVVDHEISSDNLETDSTEYNKAIKVIPIRKNDSPYAFKPYQYDIYKGNYPLYRTIYAISTGANGTLQHGFYGFLTSILGQKVILNTGVMPANMPPERAVTIQQE